MIARDGLVSVKGGDILEIQEYHGLECTFTQDVSEFEENTTKRVEEG